MSRVLKSACKALLFILLFVQQNASAQMRVDETDVISRLFSLYHYSALEVHNYYESKGYKLTEAKRVSMTSVSAIYRKYVKKGSNNYYILFEVDGHVFTVGYATSTEQDYKQAFRIMNAMEYKPIDSPAAKANQTTYARAASYDRIIITTNRLATGTEYNIQVTNLYELGKLIKQ